MNRRLDFVVASAASLFLLTGCMNSEHMRTQKQVMHEKWDASRVSVMYQLAEQQYEVGDFDKCQETLGEAFATGYPYAALHTLAAKVALEKGQLELASNHLKASVQINGNDPEPYYLLGVVYQRWLNNQAAHDYYQLAWDRKPSSPLYLLAVVEMKITMGQNDAAQKLLEDKLIYFEESAAVRAALAKLRSLKGDYATASRYYREASVLSPEDAGLKQNLAECLFYCGKFTEAVPVLELLRDDEKITDKSSVLLLLGECYMEVHRPVDARVCFDQLTRSYPHNAQAWLNLAKSAVEIDDLMQADIATRKALQEDPNDMESLILASLVQQKKMHWTKAEKTLLHAHGIEPKNTTVLCMLGLNEQKVGKPEAARDYYARALAINPQDTWARQLLASAAPAVPEAR